MGFTDQHLDPTAITATNPVNVTVVSHGMNSGMRVRATKFITLPSPNATGMEQLNNRDFVVTNPTDNTFDLYDDKGNPIDGTNYTTYVSGGQFTITGPDLDVENVI